MWREGEEIKEDLGAGDPSRASRGIEDLFDAMEGYDFFRLPWFGVKVLDGGPAPSEALQHKLVRLLLLYPAFDPPLSEEQVLHELIELVLRYGDGGVALDTSVLMQRDPALLSAGLDMLARGVTHHGPVAGACRLASWLLDGKPPVRAATVRALRTEALAGVLEHLRPELLPEELDDSPHA